MIVVSPALLLLLLRLELLGPAEVPTLLDLVQRTVPVDFRVSLEIFRYFLLLHSYRGLSIHIYLRIDELGYSLSRSNLNVISLAANPHSFHLSRL